MTNIEAIQTRIFKRRGLPPSESDIVMREPDYEEELPFPPNVIPNENVFVFPDSEAYAEALEDDERHIFEGHQEVFHSSFTFKVRNELVAQLFQSYADKDRTDDSIDFKHVATEIGKEVTAERDRHFMNANYLANTAIPAARLRPSYTPDYKNPSDYLQKDIPVLEAREEAHRAMSSYLEEFTPKSPEAALEFAEQLTRQFLPEARAEVAKILAEQIEALEAQKKALDAHIAENAARIAKLSGAQPVIEADTAEAHFREVADLTHRAKSLAA